LWPRAIRSSRDFEGGGGAGAGDHGHREHTEEQDQRQVARVLHLQNEQCDHQDQRRLQHGEDAEAGHVAQHQLGAGGGRHHDALQGAGGALSQEADGRQDEDEEEGEEADEGRRLEVDALEVRPAIVVGDGQLALPRGRLG